MDALADGKPNPVKPGRRDRQNQDFRFALRGLYQAERATFAEKSASGKLACCKD